MCSGEKDAGGVEHVPPGWDMWAGLVGNSRYFNYQLSVNGQAEKHGDEYATDYLPNVILNKTLAFLSESAEQQRKAHAEGRSEDAKPFFTVLSVPACHQPADPAPQYADRLPTIQAPRTPNYNTKNADSHWFESVQGVTGPMDSNAAAWTDLLYRRRLLTLMTIDDIVARLDQTLVQQGVWDNTYFFYTADNGYHLGQNGLGLDKRQPWETDLRIPTFVRGPGIPAGIKVPYQVGHVDITATFADMAGASPDEAAAAVGAPPLDGESMLPKIHMAQAVQEGAVGPEAQGQVRQTLLFEYHGEKNGAGGNTPECAHLTDPDLNCYGQKQDNKPPFFTGTPFCSCQDVRNNTYEGMRTHDPSSTSPASSIYTEFVTGFKELYDVEKDVWQTSNLYKAAGEQTKKELAAGLAHLRTCEGASCGRSSYPTEVEERARRAAAVAAAAAAAGPTEARATAASSN